MRCLYPEIPMRTPSRVSGSILAALVGLLTAAPLGALGASLPFNAPNVVDATASGAAAVSAADLDQDGDLDLIACAETAGRVAWYENLTGDGSSLGLHMVDPNATGAEDVVQGDIDSDGALDLVAALGGEVRLYLRDPNGGFTPSAIATPADPRRLALADLDRDGDLDVVAGAGTLLVWYENTAGDGSAWTAQTINAAAGGATGVDVADLDRDGLLDVVAAGSSSGDIVFYRNTGAGFTPATVANALGANDVGIADVDGDGDPDVAATSAGDDAVRWHENTAGDASTWTAHVVSLSADGAVSLESSDLDRDGDLDLLVASEDDHTLAWFDNTAGDASAWTERVVATTETGIRVARALDVDGDGHLDLVTAAGGLGQVRWYENASAQTHTVMAKDDIHVVDAPSGAIRARTPDISGDGRPDVLIAGRTSDTVTWFHNSGDDATTWARFTITDTASNAVAADAGRIDLDTDLDVVAAAYDDDALLWFENTAPNGSAWTEHAIAFSTGVRSAHIADIDGDLDGDVIAGGNDGKITFWENTAGDGSAWSPTVVATTGTLRYATTADVDGDLDLDILGVPSGNTVWWYENTSGDGSTWTARAVATVTDVRWVSAANMDGDGDVDLLAVGKTSGALRWYENATGDGLTWTAHEIDASMGGADSIEPIDVDHDGNVDVVLATGFSTIWYENPSPSTGAWPVHLVDSGDVPRSAATADFDADDDGDFVAAQEFASSIVSVYLNTSGDGTSWDRDDLNHSLDIPQWIAGRDLDRDGSLDLVVAHRSSDDVFIYFNRDGDGTVWDRHLAIASGALDSLQFAFSDIDQDGDEDMVGAVSSSDKVSWWENTQGDATEWLEHVVTTSALEAVGVIAPDIDSDGDPDLVVASRLDDSVRIFRNDGGGATWTMSLLTASNSPTKMHAIDMDADGDLDVGVVSENDGKTTWYENVDGLGTSWTGHLINDTLLKPRGIDIADLDGDGDLDFATASRNDDTIAWHENLGGSPPTWQTHILLDNPGFQGALGGCEGCDLECGFADGAVSVEAVDLDLDGDMDLVGAATHSSRVFWLENSVGDGSIWATHVVTTVWPTNNRWASLGDVDGDGDPDVLSVSRGANVVLWTENLLGQGALPLLPVCSDGVDNDADCLFDAADPGCAGPDSATEAPECQDNYDNDTDLLIDDPNDPQCASPTYCSESTACVSCIDTDLDGELDDCDLDDDADGLSDVDEASWATDPLDPDHDGDGLLDGDEVHVHQTDPTDADSDDDTHDDGSEILAGTDPNDPLSFPSIVYGLGSGTAAVLALLLLRSALRLRRGALVTPPGAAG